MNRVVQIMDFIDFVPEGAKYLYSVQQSVEMPENELVKAERIITGNETNNTSVLCFHYFLVNESEFEEMLLAGFLKGTQVKHKMFMDSLESQGYKLPSEGN